MTESHPPQSFLDKLQSSVQMRPKWRFWFDHAAIGAAIVFVAVGLVYIGSFVSYLWRSSHVGSLTTFGPEGYRVFVRVFPWWHLLFIILGIASVIYLVRRHTHLYRWPVIATIGVFLAAFLGATALADTTRVHDRLTNRSLAGGGIPIIGPLYRNQAPLAQGIITAAEITKAGKKSLKVTTGNENLTIKISDDTRLPNPWDPQIGDRIVIIGKRDHTTITALAIHPADELPNRRPFRILNGDAPPPPRFY